MWLLLDDVLPGGDIHAAPDPLWHLVPVQVLATLVDDPDKLPKSRVPGDNAVKGERAGCGDDGIGGGSSQHGDDGLIRLVEGKQNGSQVMEAASKQGSDKLDRVREVDGNAISTLIENVLSDKVDLPSDVVCVLRMYV